MSAERFKNVTSLEIDDLLNNKTIILLNLAEYSARFRRIIVKCKTKFFIQRQSCSQSIRFPTAGQGEREYYFSLLILIHLC